MAPLHRTAVFLWSLLLLTGLVIAQRDPESAVSYFQNTPARLFFFDDTTSVIYFDSTTKNVYVSDNEGKEWKLASGVPEGAASMVIEHPFENRYVRDTVIFLASWLFLAPKYFPTIVLLVFSPEGAVRHWGRFGSLE